MKYSIGDRVIVKESGERGIVVKFCSNDTTEKYLIYNGVPLNWHYKQELQTDLTAIEKQFGLLSKEVQEELKAVNNGENIEYQWNGEWRKRHENIYDQNYTYRLSPTYKQEDGKTEVCVKIRTDKKFAYLLEPNMLKASLEQLKRWIEFDVEEVRAGDGK